MGNSSGHGSKFDEDDFPLTTHDTIDPPSEFPPDSDGPAFASSEAPTDVGGSSPLPASVGTPPPLDMSTFPEEIKWLAGRFKEFAEALNTVAEVAQDAVAHNKAAADHNRKMASQSTILARQAQSIQVALETTLVDHGKRIAALEAARAPERLELLAEATWGQVRPPGWHSEIVPYDTLLPEAP